MIAAVLIVVFLSVFNVENDRLLTEKMFDDAIAALLRSETPRTSFVLTDFRRLGGEEYYHTIVEKVERFASEGETFENTIAALHVERSEFLVEHSPDFDIVFVFVLFFYVLATVFILIPLLFWKRLFLPCHDRGRVSTPSGR